MGRWSGVRAEGGTDGSRGSPGAGSRRQQPVSQTRVDADEQMALAGRPAAHCPSQHWPPLHLWCRAETHTPPRANILFLFSFSLPPLSLSLSLCLSLTHTPTHTHTHTHAHT